LRMAIHPQGPRLSSTFREAAARGCDAA